METQKRAPNGIWRVMRYDLNRGRDIARYIARNKFAWPGGYELFAITDDGATLCNECCHSEYWQIAHSTPGDGWHVAAADSTANTDAEVTCDHCSRTIQEDWRTANGAH